MDIPLDPELADFIKKKVHSGQYATKQEVVEGALRLMKDIDDLPAESDMDEVRGELKEAIDQLERGEGREWNLAEAQARLLQRIAARKRVD